MVSNFQKESKMKTINKNLDVLFDNWMSEAVKYGDNNFVCDGIMNGYNDWGNQLMRIAFIAKDPHYKNINELTPGVLNGEDYREYNIRQMSNGSRFWRNILAWSDGILGTPNAPIAFVNIKKEAGGATITNSVLRKYARRYQGFLKAELKEILRPNIIVCCGTSGIVMDEIYSDAEFQKMDEEGFVWFDQTNKILLIATHHPISRISDEQMYNDTVGAYNLFTNYKNR